MFDWKTLCKKLLFPPIWLIILLTVVCAALLVLVFVKGWEEHPVSYAVYVLSAYWVTVLTIFCIKVLPGYYRDIKQRIYNTKYGNRYMTDITFKNHVSLYLSLGINLLYVGTNILSYFLYRSVWFVILAGYYGILAVMRFLLLRFIRGVGVGNNLIREFRRSRLCGIILMTLNLVLSGAVLMIVYQNRGFEYHGMLIYVMAAYTFYVTTHSIVNIIKYRKYNSPVLSTAKCINLSAALVSMLSLETAMLSQFGAAESPAFRRLMVTLTGAGVSVVVVSMSAYMIIRACREIKRIKQSDSQAESHKIKI